MHSKAPPYLHGALRPVVEHGELPEGGRGVQRGRGQQEVDAVGKDALKVLLHQATDLVFIAMRVSSKDLIVLYNI